MTLSSNAKWAAKHEAIEREKAVARRERDVLVQQYMKETNDGNKKMDIQDYQFAVMKTNKAFFSPEYLESQANRRDDSCSKSQSAHSNYSAENEEERIAKKAARQAKKLKK